MILPATSYVSKDEPCFALTEVNRNGKGGYHRFQIIRVVRNDVLSDHTIDLGLSNQFIGNEFAIPGGATDELTGRIYIEHTVGELQSIAVKLRNQKPPTRQEYVEMSRWQDEQKNKRLIFS
jgi:hypothetical protein